MKAHRAAATTQSSGEGPATTNPSADVSNADAQEAMQAEQESGEGHDHDHDHGDEEHEAPAGGGLTEEQLDEQRPAGGDVDKATRDKIMKAVADAPATKEVLDAIKAKAGNLDFPIKWAKKGGYHSKGKIYIDRRKDEAKWISTLMHEAVHLRQYLLGKSANVKTQEKDAYVKTQMDEEKDAHATTYIALMQSGKESDPAAGYTEFYKKIKKDNGALLTGKKWGEIKKLALTYLENKYRNEWVGSKTGKNYYEKWEKYHDDNH